MFRFAPLLAAPPSVVYYDCFVSLPCVLAGGRAAAVSDDLETARESNVFRTDPDRFLALAFVKAFPVHNDSPFILGEAKSLRRFCSLMRQNFIVRCLNKAVRIMRVKYFSLSAVW